MSSFRRHVRGDQHEGGALAPSGSHRGRWSSWVAVAILIVGFVTTALGIVLGPPWIVAGAGVLVVVVGAVVAYAVDVWGDVVLDEPRHLPEEPHSSPRSGPEYDETRQREDEPVPERRDDHPRGSSEESTP